VNNKTEMKNTEPNHPAPEAKAASGHTQSLGALVRADFERALAERHENLVAAGFETEESACESDAFERRVEGMQDDEERLDVEDHEEELDAEDLDEGRRFGAENRRSRRNWTNAGRGQQKFDGRRDGKLMGPGAPVRLAAKPTRLEKWLYAMTPDEFRGTVCGHSLCCTHTYVTIDRTFASVALTVRGNGPSKLRWVFDATAEDREMLQRVVEQYWLLKAEGRAS
jgi:hypothetical protein